MRHVYHVYCKSARRGLLVLAAAALVGLAAPAGAAIYDFNAIADGASFESTTGPRIGFEGSWAAVVGGVNDMIFDGGIGLRATGTNISGDPAHAFFDSDDAGLGVCSSVSCKTGVPGANTADDNLNRAEEALILDFTQVVKVTGMTIRNASHDLANGSFEFYGQSFDIVNGIVDAGALALLSPAASFTMRFIANGPEIYVSDVTVSAIPLPAGLVLLVSGLASLGLVRSRRATG
jgi:hypothetical protein